MSPPLPPLAEILDLVPDAVCVVEPDGTFLFVSASFERIFGYAREDVLGRRMIDLVHPDDRASTLLAAQRVMDGTLQRHFRNRYVHKDGHAVDVQWSARWLPEYGVRIAVAHEVTELRRAERELEHLATHDALTGLPNRHLLRRELRHAIEGAVRTDGGLALLYLDLDGFKAANDRGGHEAGDRLLREVAHRLQAALRQGDLVARVGGDEFVVLLNGCRDVESAHDVAESLRSHLHPPFSVAGESLCIDASVGIACFPSDATDSEGLLSYADRAMYAVKRTRPGH